MLVLIYFGKTILQYIIIIGIEGVFDMSLLTFTATSAKSFLNFFDIIW